MTSQRQEGWRVLRPTMMMAAIPAEPWIAPPSINFLRDVEDGKVDVIVVYKVDRLTRSLADFAKIIEILDRTGVIFVSVTQQFNTTSPWGGSH